MKQLILTQFPWPWLSTLALMIFFVFFIGLIVRVNQKSRAPIFKESEVLPLSDGEKYE